MRIAPIAVPLLVLATGCQRASAAADSPCAQPLSQYCEAHPKECPTSASAVPFCQWLTGRGGRFYSGPASCPGQGSGWQVDSPDGGVWYLFDDGDLSAIVDLGPDGGCRAGAGPATGLCFNGDIGFGCAIDAARE